MTTTTIRSVPRKLPKAAIYLDDLFEVERILSESFSRSSKPQNVSFEYRVDGDLKMTTHEDLIEHGGESSNFALLVITGADYRSVQSVVSFYGGIDPAVDFPYELKEQSWPLYAQVQQIFESRTSKLKKVVAQIPSSLLYQVYGAATGLWIMIPMLAGIALKFKAYVALFLLIFFCATIYVPAFILVRTDKKEAKIYFRHQRDDEKARQTTRREWIGKVVLVILGAIAGIIGTLITRLLTGSH